MFAISLYICVVAAVLFAAMTVAERRKASRDRLDRAINLGR